MTINPETTCKYPPAIAIDGPAASGKTTVGAQLAKKMGYLCLDTGVMYRAVTLAALEAGIPIEDEEGVSELARTFRLEFAKPSVEDGRLFDILINGEDRTLDIRSSRVNQNVSEVSAYPEVRNAMTKLQWKIARKGNIVMIGRDIGTVVLPRSKAKFYLEASLEVRAERRCKEELSKGKKVELSEIIRSLKHRDDIDGSRKIAPMSIAKDAIVIKTDNMTPEEVVETMVTALCEKDVRRTGTTKK